MVGGTGLAGGFGLFGGLGLTGFSGSSGSFGGSGDGDSGWLSARMSKGAEPAFVFEMWNDIDSSSFHN